MWSWCTASLNIRKYFPRFLYFAIITLAYGLAKYVAKYEKLGKYFPYCTRHHTITATYHTNLISISNTNYADPSIKSREYFQSIFTW